MSRRAYEWENRLRTVTCPICGREFTTLSMRRKYCGSPLCEEERRRRKAARRSKLALDKRARSRLGCIPKTKTRIQHMDEISVHDINNNLKGSLVAVEQRSPDSPTHVGIITIGGVKLRMVVYPLRVSRKGRAYNPVRLSYLADGGMVLRAAPATEG